MGSLLAPFQRPPEGFLGDFRSAVTLKWSRNSDTLNGRPRLPAQKQVPFCARDHETTPAAHRRAKFPSLGIFLMGLGREKQLALSPSGGTQLNPIMLCSLNEIIRSLFYAVALATW